MLLKRVKKVSSLIIMSILLSNSIVPTVDALDNLQKNYLNENSSDDNLYNSLESINYYENVKNHIRKLYGSNDEFVPGVSYGSFYTEVNGAKGILRMNQLDDEGNTINTYDINLFENSNKIINNIEEEFLEEAIPRKSVVLSKVTTGSPIDNYSLAVYTNGNYNSDFRISIGNSKGATTNYYKNTSWNTGNTANFYSNLTSAKGQITTIKNRITNGTLFAAAMSAISKFIPGSATIILDEIIAILSTVGISAVTAGAIGPNIVTYLIKIRNCGTYYNLIIK